MRVLVAATSKSARGDRDRIAPGRHGALDHLAVTRYDVAVLDRDLPGVHGDEVCRRLAAERSQSRTLMLTAASLIGIESTSVPQRGGTARSLKSKADHAA
jgi:DNA-binding response OmpR family regulator